MKNVGSLKNYGVELAFDVKPIVTKDFTWDITYNVGWNHNEITSLDAGAQDWVWTGDKISRGNNTKILKNKVGEAVNSFFVYQQVYDENGKPIEGLYVDRNADGQINDDDRYYYKNPAADVIMGLPLSSSIRIGTSVWHSVHLWATTYIMTSWPTEHPSRHQVFTLTVHSATPLQRPLSSVSQV